MNNTIAVFVGHTAVYWSGIIIALGIAGGFLLSYSLYTAHSGRGNSMWVLLALSLVIGVLLSRGVHWYCNQEQYNGLARALTDYTGGSFWLPGALAGVVLAALLVKAFGMAESAGELLDAAAPGMMLTVAHIRFSAVYTNACRSMFTVQNRKLHLYPFASADADAAGNVTWHFATFMFMAIAALVIFAVSMVMYYRRHAVKMKPPCSRTGNIARMTLVLYCVTELVLDSTRSDSVYVLFTFLQFLNKYVSFVSLTQLAAAVSVLAVMIYYARCARRAKVKKSRRVTCLVLYIVSLLGVGVTEYCVQRFTSAWRLCYALQSASALLMAVAVSLLYASLRLHRVRRTFSAEQSN